MVGTTELRRRDGPATADDRRRSPSRRLCNATTLVILGHFDQIGRAHTGLDPSCSLRDLVLGVVPPDNERKGQISQARTQ